MLKYKKPLLVLAALVGLSVLVALVLKHKSE